MAHSNWLAFVALLVLPVAPVAVQASSASASHGQPAGALTVAYDDESDNAHSPGAKDRGVVVGQVVDIDYGRGVVTLQTQHKGKLEIVVSPSTSILSRDNDYGTISDIARGSRLSVFISEVDGHLVAQIIHIH
ncbi:MAG: hypothetical protein GIW98_04905 [Candidatus Eremiobacteraeota bacterium]|nr:hypothetical protein [Candidatus Eremiobacteraeota bacterium]